MNKDTRTKDITRAGIIGILANIGLALVKIAIGSITGSVAVVSDAVNNLSDAGSSVLTILGSFLAGKDPDEKHPYGYGRIEYITGLVISILVLVVGVEFLQTSIKAILHPNQVKFSGITIGIMILTLGIKLLLGFYTKGVGKRASSPALIASGTEALGDCAVTAVTVIAAVIALATDVAVDGYAGLIVSGFVLYSGIRLVFDTFNDIIGKRYDKEVASILYSEIEAVPMIKGAYDLILHNYGPERYIGSVNVEIEDYHTVAELSDVLLPLQALINQKYGIFLVFGFYSVNTKDTDTVVDREHLWELLKTNPDILNFHAFYIDRQEKRLRFDVTVSFRVKDNALFRQELIALLEKDYPNYTYMINIDHRYGES